MEAIYDLLDWAKTQNIVLHGIAPHAFPGRGIGLISTKTIQEGDTILEVPISAIKTLDTVPAALRDALPAPPDTTVHALLALDLALDASTYPAPWRAVLPSREDISTLPLTWDQRLQKYLPGAARELLEKQQAKFAKDLATCRAAFPDLDPDTYRHAWLLVNSRTFYHVSPRTEGLPKEDHLSLQPVADLFNHASQGCSVKHPFHNKRNGPTTHAPAQPHTTGNYTITANTTYPRGVEVPIRYGCHNNDFLLVEYGFILPGATNEWDETSLDDLLGPRLGRSPSRRNALQHHDFWGGYVLDAQDVCFRTQVAVRSLLRTEAEWLRFALNAVDSEAAQRAVSRKLRSLLELYNSDIEDTIEAVRELDLQDGVGTASQKETQKEILIARWEQVQAMVRATIARYDENHGAGY
ncbi:SET domain-containing protein [Sodiomyces alkalinus F11]|uniref:SET domain-containing protein n=1 Tax=Sodiomyces alkalinus (strain CBS 110278 / VKM F-3762 / F11) TaxID=1314773 RepID=A0A3N2PT11_SODAK|nr:SET domain-containing protein [Sodiomyces alkalinus F11]ROT37663.1 SET domain-containing protein [Sodiomyces alkalinus F11]